MVCGVPDRRYVPGRWVSLVLASRDWDQERVERVWHLP